MTAVPDEPQAVATARVCDALVGRMVELTRKMAAIGGAGGYADCQGAHDEAKAIVAELPAPVDPDLIEARLICDKYTDRPNGGKYSRGEWDKEAGLIAVLEAIKRGRELSEQSK